MMNRNDERFVIFNWAYSIVTLIKLNWIHSGEDNRLDYHLLWHALPITLKNQRFAPRIHVLFMFGKCVCTDFSTLVDFLTQFFFHIIQSIQFIRFGSCTKQHAATIHGCCYTGQTFIFRGCVLFDVSFHSLLSSPPPPLSLSSSPSPSFSSHRAARYHNNNSEAYW